MAKIRLINGRQARMIEATISLPAEELARLLSANITDRHAAMVQQHGEACTKTTAARDPQLLHPDRHGHAAGRQDRGCLRR